MAESQVSSTSGQDSEFFSEAGPCVPGPAVLMLGAERWLVSVPAFQVLKPTKVKRKGAGNELYS